MKKRHLSILVIAIALGACFWGGYRNTSHDNTIPASVNGSDIAEEGGSERLEYEWSMLHDPESGMIPGHIREKELAFAATIPSDHFGNPLAKTTGSNWQSRGPWNVGGRTRAFAIDATNENILIAGSASGGMWRSTDQGQSWVPTTAPGQHQSVSCVAQDVRTGKGNVWYSGTGEGSGASASATGAYYLGNGIYKSADSGKTWSILPSTTSSSLTTFDVWGDVIWNLVTNPANSTQDEILAAAYGGIYRSTDGGGSWTLVKGTFSGTVSYYTDVAISQTGIFYVSLSSDGPQKGIYRSVDGITFTDITPSNFPTVYERIKIAISPSDENQLYFLGNTPGFGKANANYLGTIEWNSLWKYTYLAGDGSAAGGAWDDRSVNLPASGGPFDKFATQGSYDVVVKVKPNDPNTVFIGGTNLYGSTSGFTDSTHTSLIGGYNEGATLPIVQQYPNQHPDQQELVFLPSNANKMISANDGGIFFTSDNTGTPVSWSSLNNGYLTSMFYTCAIDHAASDNVIIAGAQDNGSWYTNSINLTTPWANPRGGDGSYCAIADNKNAFYFSIQNGKMMKAKLNTSGGIDSFARIDPIGATKYLFINPYILDPNNNNIMYLAGGKNLWRNNDLSGIPYASNWDSITTNWVQFPDSVPTANARITTIAVSKAPANRVYYGTSARRVYRIDNADAGTPARVDITGITAAAAFPNASVSSIAVDPNNADNVMVTFSNYNVYSIFYSDNGGTTWAKAGGNLEATATGTGNGPSIRWARIIPVSGGTVYLVGASTGLYATTQLNGLATTWVQQGANTIGNSVVTMIDSRSTDGLVVVATHSHGIYTDYINGLNDITGVRETQPESFSKLSGYPNPFRDETTIRFHVNKQSNVSLSIYDEMGRLVRTIADERMYPGERKYMLTGNSFPGGVYYCTLRSGNSSKTIKLLKQ